MEGAYTLKMFERGDWYMACLAVNIGNDVSVDVKAKVSMSAIARLLNADFAGTFNVPGMSGEGDVMGWFGSKIFKAVKKVVKKVAKSKVFKVAKKIFRNPVFKGVAMAIPGVNVAVGALTAADLAMQAAGGVAKAMRGPKGRRPSRKAVKLARRRAKLIKRRAARQARRRRVPAATFGRAWKSGWGAVPDPRLLAMIRAYSGPQNPQQMFRQAMPQMQRGYMRQLPGFMQQYARAY